MTTHRETALGLASSVDSLLRSVAANPRDLRAYGALAAAYESAGKFGKAELTLRQAIEVDPLHHRAWVQLGAFYGNRGEWRRSADAFEQACALDAEDASSWIGCGLALTAAQDLALAGRAGETLLKRFPDRAESHLMAGHLAKIRGRFGEAAAAYQRALQIEPRQTDAWFNLVDLDPPELTDSATVGLERLRQDPGLTHRQSANVRFALARIHERAGEAELAFTLFQEANAAAQAALRGLGHTYDPGKSEDEARRIIDLFGPEAAVQPIEPLELDLKMTFIVGMPRSGTTLVERILCSHSRVGTAGELPFMQDSLAKLLAWRRSTGRRGGGPQDEAERRLLLQLREDYLDGLFERDPDGEYVIDKLPANFCALGLIHMLFPDALIIHCVRHPVATCWSLYTAHFGTHLAYYTSLEHLAHYYGHFYSRLMRHWQSVLGARIIHVSYEQLVMDPQRGIRELLGLCGLPWEETCLRFHELERPIHTASFRQARQPISTASISRWRRFEKYLAPLIGELKDLPELDGLAAASATVDHSDIRGSSR